MTAEIVLHVLDSTGFIQHSNVISLTTTVTVFDGVLRNLDLTANDSDVSFLILVLKFDLIKIFQYIQ